MSAVDWSRWRKCPVCYAEVGEACLALSGARFSPVPGRTNVVRVPRDQPHSTRKPLTGGKS